jgi:hypothetical protein
VFTVRVDEEAVFMIGPQTFEGTGQFTIDHTLDEGTNNIIINVEDKVGNPATSYLYTIILDDVPPLLVITYPTDGFLTHLAQVSITGTTEDGRSLVWIDDVPAGVRSDGGFELTMPLEWGDNTFTVRSKDRAGNEVTKSIVVERREKEEVKESNVGVMAMALVIGLVIGIAVMYALSSMGRSKGKEEKPDEFERFPPRPPEDAPKPPPGGPEAGSPEDGPSWEEY